MSSVFHSNVLMLDQLLKLKRRDEIRENASSFAELLELLRSDFVRSHG